MYKAELHTAGGSMNFNCKFATNKQTIKHANDVNKGNKQINRRKKQMHKAELKTAGRSMNFNCKFVALIH